MLRDVHFFHDDPFLGGGNVWGTISASYEGVSKNFRTGRPVGAVVSLFCESV
jgi:hypothetical protein